MNRIHVRRLVGVLTALAAVLATAIADAPAAFAQPDSSPGPGAHPRHPIPFLPHTHAAAGGIAGWQVVLMLVAAGLLGAAVTIRISRAPGSPAAPALDSRVNRTAPGRQLIGGEVSGRTSSDAALSDHAAPPS